MNFHPLFVYLVTGILLLSYTAYLLHFLLLRNYKFVFYYALTNHALSAVLSPFTVLTGFYTAGIQYVQQKAPFVFLFPHKWLGVALAVYTVLTFAVLWIKQRELSRKAGIVFSLLGLGLSVAVIVLGWLLRLIFF